VSDTLERGSAKLFEIKTHDHAALAEAVGIARNELKVTGWHRVGLPPFPELVKLTVEVGPDQLGSTVARFLNLNSPHVRVVGEVFPYGLLNPGFLLEITAETQAQR
jgi:hypothetical protein